MPTDDRSDRRKLTDDEVSKFGALLLSPDPEPEVNWQRGIARNAWVLIGAVLICSAVVGMLIGRVTDSEAREHSEFRKGLKDLGAWLQNVDSRTQSMEQRLSSYGDDSRRAVRMMEDMQREQLEYYRTEAEIRGDYRAARRISRKLAQLPPAPESGQ